jgi:hypothetical protein
MHQQPTSANFGRNRRYLYIETLANVATADGGAPRGKLFPSLGVIERGGLKCHDPHTPVFEPSILSSTLS